LIEGRYYYKEHKISQSHEMQKLYLAESDLCSRRVGEVASLAM